MRRLLTAVSAFSAVLCLIVIAMWSTTISAERLINTPRLHVSLYRTSVTVVVDHGPAKYPSLNDWSIGRYWYFGGSDDVWGFNLERVYSNDGVKVGLPYWLLIGLFAILPCRRIVIHRRERQLAMLGRCASCGYDLTANVSGICPECGTPVQPNITPQTAAGSARLTSASRRLHARELCAGAAPGLAAIPPQSFPPHDPLTLRSRLTLPSPRRTRAAGEA